MQRQLLSVLYWLYWLPWRFDRSSRQGKREAAPAAMAVAAAEALVWNNLRWARRRNVPNSSAQERGGALSWQLQFCAPYCLQSQYWRFKVAVEGLQGPSAGKAAHRIPAPIVRICGMEVTKGETYWTSCGWNSGNTHPAGRRIWNDNRQSDGIVNTDSAALFWLFIRPINWNLKTTIS